MKLQKYIYIPVFLILITLVLFGVQYFVVEQLSDKYTFFYPVWSIYSFHFLVTFFILTALYFVGKIFPNYIGFLFMGSILLKMIAAVVFLIPLIKMQNVSKIPDFISFFTPYFIYLFIEIVLTVNVLHKYARGK